MGLGLGRLGLYYALENDSRAGGLWIGKRRQSGEKPKDYGFAAKMQEACIWKHVPNMPSSTQRTAQLHVILQLCVEDAKQASGRNSNFLMSNPDSSDSLDILCTSR